MEKRYDYVTPHDFEIAKLNGITESALTQRVYNYGWDIDRAITQPMRVSKSFESVWRKWERVATKNGVDRENFVKRVRALGWTEEESATIKKGQGRPSGMWTKEELETAKRNGIEGNSMSVPRARINMLGWSREDAVNTPKITEAERLKRVAEGTRKYHEERGVNREFNKVI